MHGVFSIMYETSLLERNFDTAADYALAVLETYSYPYPRPLPDPFGERREIQHLAAIAPDMSPECRARTIDALRQIEVSHVTRDVRFDHEAEAIDYYVWRYCADDWRTGFWNEVRRLVGASRDHDLRKLLRHNSVYLRLGQIELALAQFEHDHNRLPDSLGELVPDYLPRIPQDPYGAGPLRYRRTTAGHQVYSVGFDGRDNAGAPYDFHVWGPQPDRDLSLVDPKRANYSQPATPSP